MFLKYQTYTSIHAYIHLIKNNLHLETTCSTIKIQIHFYDSQTGAAVVNGLKQKLEGIDTGSVHLYMSAILLFSYKIHSHPNNLYKHKQTFPFKIFEKFAIHA